LEKIKIIDWKSILNVTPIEDLEQLEKFCDLAPNRLAIEVGSYEGGSTAVLAQYFETVIAIDPWGEHNTKPGDSIATFTEGTAGTNSHFPAFNKNMHKLGLCDIVIPLVSTVTSLKILPYLNAGLAFVDDGHTHFDCKRDINAVLPHLCKDGILVCHDYYNEFGGSCGAYIGVTEAVNEAIGYYNLEIIKHTGGIIAMRKKY